MKYNRWDDDEIERMTVLRSQGVPWSQVASSIRRDVSSCQVKYGKLRAEGKLPSLRSAKRRFPIVTEAEEHESLVEEHELPAQALPEQVEVASPSPVSFDQDAGAEPATPSERLVRTLNQAMNAAVVGALKPEAVESIERLSAIYLRVLELNLKAMQVCGGEGEA